ncbi:glycosyltransferase family 2 protein [Candidatus Parcubacteria bacterium]|nr:glycosyltransferase family 2 protein [Patescibacteria group bacterium]MCG2693878.1 glycosyltransferase family 2 protein [Candidatus Parcubacteria bacterium]
MEQRDFHATINIVTWNSEEYIEDLLVSLEAQTFLGFHIIIVDNASSDRTLSIIEKHSNITLIKNGSNLGFSRAHNKGINMALKFWDGKSLDDRFIIVCNPDVVLKEDCLEKLISSLYKEKQTAVMGPKLLRIFDEEVDNLSHKSKSNTIDSLGIRCSKSRKAIDSCAGEEDGHNIESKSVFAISGAFMCIRVLSLPTIKQGKEYFDEDFFAYKEDIDLCWRLRNMGWDIKIEPGAVAYHYRKVRGDEKASLLKKMQNQKLKPRLIKLLSVRNHFWLVWKNDFLSNKLIHLPFIITREFGNFFYNFIFDRKILGAYLFALYGMPKMMRKRKYLKNAKIDAKEIRKWFGQSKIK